MRRRQTARAVAVHGRGCETCPPIRFHTAVRCVRSMQGSIPSRQPLPQAIAPSTIAHPAAHEIGEHRPSRGNGWFRASYDFLARVEAQRMVRALNAFGATLLVVGLLLVSPARDLLPVDLLPSAERLLAGADAPRFVKIVPSQGVDGLALTGAALAGAGMVVLVVSRRLGGSGQPRE